MLGDSIMDGFNSYRRNTMAYAYISFLAVFFHLLTFFAALGVIILVFFMFSIINLSLFSLYGMILLVLVGIWLLWLCSGIQGARIKFYSNILNGRISGLRATFAEFFGYALANASEFFLVSFIRLIALAIPLGILAYLYLFAQQYTIPYLDMIIAIIGLAEYFIINFLFFPVFISLAVNDKGINGAFGDGIKMLLKANVKALFLYFAYGIVWVLDLIPILQVITLFFVYPLAYVSLISMFRRATQ